MPELPEVETIKRELARKVLKKKILDVKVNPVRSPLRGTRPRRIASNGVNKPRVIKEPSVVKFKKELIGQTPEKIIRKAKVLIIKLKEDKFLIVHLRISGWLLYGKEDEKARVVFKLSGGKFLNYMDSRLLGELRLRKDYRDLKFIKELGPEPFDLNLTKFKEIIKSRKAKIKVLLMNQKIISGIGNIYAQEALFLSKILPRRPACSLSDKEIKALRAKITLVLNTAIKHKGSSVDTYRGLKGEKGGMEKRLKVYGRKNKPCFTCKRPIKKIFLGGRGTCFCPRCQK